VSDPLGTACARFAPPKAKAKANAIEERGGRVEREVMALED